jgi:hypothetical protein
MIYEDQVSYKRIIIQVCTNVVEFRNIGVYFFIKLDVNEEIKLVKCEWD